MFRTFSRQPLSTKLLTASLAFLLPVGVLWFFMDLSFRYDLGVVRSERAALALQRELFGLLEDAHDCGDAEVDARVHAHLDALPRLQALLVTALASTSDELAMRGRDALAVAELQGRWLACRAAAEQQRHSLLAGRLEVFRTAVREHMGTVYEYGLLATDPALDSATLSRALLDWLPDVLREVEAVRATPADVSVQQATGLQAAAGLHRDGLGRLLEGVRRAVRADASFYGVAGPLQADVPPALVAFEESLTEAVALLESSQPVSATLLNDRLDRVLADGYVLFATGADALDALLALRADAFWRWRVMSTSLSLLAVLLACGLVVHVARGVRMQVGSLVRYADAVTSGHMQAQPDAHVATQGHDLARLATALTTMVASLRGQMDELAHKDAEIAQLAAFPLENPEPVIACGPQGEVIFNNASAGEVLDELGIGWTEFVPPKHTLIIASVLADGQPQLGVERSVQGRSWIFNYKPIVPANLSDETAVASGMKPMVHIYVYEITELKRLEHELGENALRDGLTGLANRVLLTDRIGLALRRASAGTEVAVLLFDIDRFKLINDSLGHAQGDALLRAVAERVRARLGPGDTLARVGSDEFAVVLEPGASDTEAEGVHRTAADMARALLAAMAEPFVLSGVPVSLTISVGIATEVVDAGKKPTSHRSSPRSPSRSPDELLRDADTAMFRTKADGGNGFTFFEQAMRGEAVDRFNLEIEIKEGLAEEQFVPWLQPFVDGRTGRIAGFEALARWNHPERGVVFPGGFIPLMEETGQVVELGRQMLGASCHILSGWRAELASEVADVDSLSLSVNLAVKHLLHPQVLEHIDGALSQCGLPYSALKLEITETGLMQNMTTATQVMAALKERGAHLAIDDFGTGYSSLAYLHTIPFDYLKVDYSFVSRMMEEPVKMEIVRTTLALSRGLGKLAIAEGVETRAQYDALREMGCEFFQGYLFAKPAPPREVTALLRDAPRY